VVWGEDDVDDGWEGGDEEDDDISALDCIGSAFWAWHTCVWEICADTVSCMGRNNSSRHPLLRAKESRR